MESLVFVALTPLAAALMLAVAGVAWQRREAPGGRALVAFSLASAGWLVCDALSVLAPTPEATIRLALAATVWMPLPGAAWLAFVLAYTGRLSQPARVAVGALTAWSVAYGALALTTRSHRLVWSAWQTAADGPFTGVAFTLGPVAWVQTGLMWAAVVVSLGVLWRAMARPHDRVLSWWIVVGATVPLVASVVHLVGFGPIEKDFTPVAMGVSAAAFALGLGRYRFLDLRPIARAALVDSLRDGVLVLDVHGCVADVNPALRAALGPDAAVLDRPLDATAPDLARAIADAPDDVFHLGDAGPCFDLRVSPLTDRHGTPTGLLVLIHDVTRRRQERAELHRTNAALHVANAELTARNDELDAFAHTVAHDLKNSIHSVGGWAEVLLTDGPGLPDDEHHEVASAVVRSAHKMGTVVDELLLLAGVRQGAVEPLPVDMTAVVAEALGRVRDRYTLSPALPDAWPDALGHAPWIEEVWTNYLSNAAKYGGPTVTLGADEVGGQVRFWVHDDGAGLPAEAQQQLFVPFSRVGETAVEGHGLGLSIVRRIAERLGGMCGVQSASGAGTRFWFSLPAAEGPEMPS